MYILIIAYTIRTIRALLYHLSWWHVKEYRFDRMIVHLRETVQGRQWLYGHTSMLKWLLLAVYIAVPKSHLFITAWFYLLLAVYVFEAGQAIVAFRYGWKRPPARPRAIGIYSIATMTILLLVFISLPDVLFIILVADKLLGVYIAMLVFISNRVFDVHKGRRIAAARKKILLYPDLKVIGVTGSYGKTTTKELITQILRHKYNTISTIYSQNSDIGIAERVLNANLTGVEYFICEMAAYHPGEIASSCSIFPGRITGGIVTGINEQHLSLFGSMNVTRTSKYELVQNITHDGFVVFNAHSKKAEPMVARAKKSSLGVHIAHKSILIGFTVDLPAEHFKENTALAVKTALLAGMDIREIKKAVASLKFPSKTLEHIKKGSITQIDSTFNANPDAVYSALDHLAGYNGKKMLVLQPLIELGTSGDTAHEKIGARAAGICDYILLTNRNFNSAFMKGIKRAKASHKPQIVDTMPAIEKGVILFQGKEAAQYLRDGVRV